MVYFEYPTNYSGGQEVSGVADFFFGYPNSILDYWFAGGWLLFVWLFAFILMLPFSSRKALLVSSFACSIFSGYLWSINQTNPIFFFTFVVLTVVGAVGSMAEKTY